MIYFFFCKNEREPYEVIIEDGKLVYKESGAFVETAEGSKWIFVLSTTRILYVGQKKKGLFQHSSFLAGGAITAAGRLIVHSGVLEVNIHTEPEYMQFFMFQKQINRVLLLRFEFDDLVMSLQAIWPYSGHYHPTEENFREFISFLEEHCVDLVNVKVIVANVHPSLIYFLN